MCIFIFFFKQKTAYEMRISDWSSDVCSSDLYRDFFHVMSPLCPYRLKTYRLAIPTAIACRHIPLFIIVFRHAPDELPRAEIHIEIGRASCRERGCQYV